MRSYRRSLELNARARRVLSGGVNSNLRGGETPVPIAFERARGSRLWDLDGNETIDYQLGQGALLLGHSDPDWVDAIASQLAAGAHHAAQSVLEVRVAERLCRAIASLEMVRFTSSASEAVLAALRLARACTGRQRFLRFEGHYHGWTDDGLTGFVVSPERWADDRRSVPGPASSGSLPGSEDQFVLGRWNDPEGLRALLQEHGDGLAGLIFEPIMLNTGCIPPTSEFLDVLRSASATGCLLICDETITGFRFGIGGAQEHLGLRPDLTIFGKALGCGVPVGALGGRSDVLGRLTSGDVAHGGTFNGNPLCMAAVEHVLDRIEDASIGVLEARMERLSEGLRSCADAADVPLTVTRYHTIVHTGFCGSSRPTDYRTHVEHDDPSRFAALRRGLLDDGVRVLDRGLWFSSLAHGDDDVEETIDAFRRVLAQLADESSRPLARARRR